MRKIIFSIFILSLFYFGAYKTFAQCACHPKPTVQYHFQRSDVVFVGRVIEAKKILGENSDNSGIAIKFEVKQTWKQDLEKFVIVKELYDTSTDDFEPNAEWLLYAFKSNDGTLQIVTHCCSRTKPLSVVKEDLRDFERMGEKPKKIIKNNDEPNNSLDARQKQRLFYHVVFCPSACA